MAVPSIAEKLLAGKKAGLEVPQPAVADARFCRYGGVFCLKSALCAVEGQVADGGAHDGAGLRVHGLEHGGEGLRLRGRDLLDHLLQAEALERVPQLEQGAELVFAQRFLFYVRFVELSRSIFTKMTK